LSQFQNLQNQRNYTQTDFDLFNATTILIKKLNKYKKMNNALIKTVQSKNNIVTNNIATNTSHETTISNIINYEPLLLPNNINIINKNYSEYFIIFLLSIKNINTKIINNNNYDNNNNNNLNIDTYNLNNNENLNSDTYNLNNNNNNLYNYNEIDIINSSEQFSILYITSYKQSKLILEYNRKIREKHKNFTNHYGIDLQIGIVDNNLFSLNKIYIANVFMAGIFSQHNNYMQDIKTMILASIKQMLSRKDHTIGEIIQAASNIYKCDNNIRNIGECLYEFIPTQKNIFLDKYEEIMGCY
jgi:hypothetical protein